MYGPVAGTCMNIGAAIAIGITAGFISSLFFKKVYTLVNSNGVRDSFGILLVFLISFLATFVISPIVIKAYYNYSVNLKTLEVSSADSLGSPISIDAAGWVLIYVAISMGIGLATGAVTGITLYILDKLSGHEYDDAQIFSRDRCLNEVGEVPESLNNKPHS